MTEERVDSAEDAPFARDFGYLDKFLIAVNEHAASIAGSRGERLRALLAGEVERFAEIRDLLAGEEPNGALLPPESESNATDDEAGRPRSGGSARSNPSAPGRDFTVGSLLGDRRRDARDGS